MYFKRGYNIYGPKENCLMHYFLFYYLFTCCPKFNSLNLATKDKLGKICWVDSLIKT